METGNGGYARAHVQSSLLWPPRGKSAFHRRSRHGLVHQRHIPARWRHGGLYGAHAERSEEHTSELQSLMRISYAVFCLKKKKINILTTIQCVAKIINTRSAILE